MFASVSVVELRPFSYLKKIIAVNYSVNFKCIENILRYVWYVNRTDASISLMILQKSVYLSLKRNKDYTLTLYQKNIIIICFVFKII